MENGSPKIIEIDGAELVSAMRASSKGRLENLLTKYRKAGFSDRLGALLNPLQRINERIIRLDRS